MHGVGGTTYLRGSRPGRRTLLAALSRSLAVVDELVIPYPGGNAALAVFVGSVTAHDHAMSQHTAILLSRDLAGHFEKQLDLGLFGENFLAVKEHP